MSLQLSPSPDLARIAAHRQGAGGLPTTLAGAPPSCRAGREVWISEHSTVCARVNASLDARGFEYEAIQVDDDDLRERMLKETGRTTCPLVVVGEVIVGGLEETAAADRWGELRRLVATA
jgi:glutaredoxin